MKLHIEIKDLLKKIKRPLSYLEIAERINNSAESNNLRKDISNVDIQLSIYNYPSLFEQIDGRVILASDEKWRVFLTSYTYLLNILRGFFSNSELQFLIAVLFLNKRILESTEKDEYLYQIAQKSNFIIKASNLEIYTFENWLKAIREIDHANKFPFLIFTEFEVLIRKIGASKIYEVLSFMETIDISTFDTTDFGIAFEYLIEVNISDNYRSGLVRTPPQIIELMVRLLNPGSGTVFDPVSGVGGFLSALSKVKKNDLRIKGTEIAASVAQLCFMNLLMHGVENPDVSASNCFDELKDDLKYDYIIGDLPLLGVQNNTRLAELSNHFKIKLPESGKGFSSILVFILEKLNSKGKAVLTVSDSFLSAGGADEKVRELLIQNDLIEAIVSLPMNSLKPYTNGKASLLIINREKPPHLLGKVKFINSSKTSSGNKLATFDSGKVLSSYFSGILDDEDIQLVDLNEIENANTLQVSFYTEKFHRVSDLLRSNNAMLLGDLVEISSGSALKSKEDANFNQGIPFVKIENLEKDILDMRLSIENLTNYFADPTEYKKSLYQEEILMVARIGEHLKPTYFQPNEALRQIITHSNVISLKRRINHGLDLEYLYYQLYSPFVQKQVEQNRTGSVMPTITLAALRNLVIPYMPIKLQREFIASQKENIIVAEKERVAQRLKLVGFKEQESQTESEVVSTLVHELRPKLLSFHTFARLLVEKINNQDFNEIIEIKSEIEELDPEISILIEPKRNHSINTIAEKLLSDAEKMNDVLNLVKEVMGFKLRLEDFRPTDITSLIRNHLEKKETISELPFKWSVSATPVILDLHCDSFLCLIDQLISNAMTHGFLSPSTEDKISFEVRENKARKIATVEYSNNGDPMRVSEKDYISFFQKSRRSPGSGIGGNYVYRIIKSHKGKLRIKENQSKGFNMTIELPIEQGHG